MDDLASEVAAIFAEAQHLGDPRPHYVHREHGRVRSKVPGKAQVFLVPLAPERKVRLVSERVEAIGVTRLRCPDCRGIVERRVGVRQAFHIARGACRWIGVGLDVR